MTAPVVSAGMPALDPALPGLAAALSARAPEAVPGRSARLRSVEWCPRRRCALVHEVRGPGRTTTLVASEVTPSGTRVHPALEDPALPGLASALDADEVARRLGAVLPAPLRTCRVTPIAWRPGSRAVLAYDVTTVAGRWRYYAKLLAEGPDRYAAAADAIVGAARRRHGPPPVPEVLAVWPDAGAVIQRAAPGQSLSGLLANPSLPERRRLHYAGLLGGLLADVHTTPPGEVPTAGPGWDHERELCALEGLLAPAWHADPAAGRGLAALVDRLADRLPVQEAPVLAHGAFRTGQVVALGGVLTLLDLDTVGTSQAARDIGNALAYLAWSGVRGALRPETGAAYAEAFLDGYGRIRRAPDAATIAWWTAAAMAKIAGRRYRSLAVIEWPHVPALLELAGVRLGSVPAGSDCTADGSPDGFPDTDAVTAALRTADAATGRPTDGELRVTGTRTLAEAAGRRRVLRVEVEGPEPGRASTLIGKVHTHRHRSWVAHENLRLLRDEVFADSPDLAVPDVVALVPALRMVLYREVTGTALDRLPVPAAVAGAEAAARWLAALHGSPVVLARRLDLGHEVAEVARWAAVVGERAPSAGTAAADLAERLAQVAGTLPGVPEVPVHKDFHAGHVLAVEGADGSSGIVVLDLDEARMADPALDVAHFAACLDASPRDGAREVRDAFLSAYGSPPGPEAELRSAFWSAWAAMKVARQLVTGRGPVRVPEGTDPAEATLAALRRGSACLAG